MVTELQVEDKDAKDVLALDDTKCIFGRDAVPQVLVAPVNLFVATQWLTMNCGLRHNTHTRYPTIWTRMTSPTN